MGVVTERVIFQLCAGAPISLVHSTEFRPELAKPRRARDIVKDDLSSLARKNMSQADKDKLAAWMDLTNDLGKVIAAQCNQALAMKLGASSPLASETEGDVVTRKVNESMDNADVYAALAALTAACNANPVIFLKFPANFTYSGLGINADSDNLAHRLDNANMRGPCVPDVVQTLLKIDSYYAQKFAKLVGMLDRIDEGDGNRARQHDRRLDERVFGRLRAQPEQRSHHPGWQRRGYFKTGKIVHLDAASGATAQQMLGGSLSQCVEGTDMMADASARRRAPIRSTAMRPSTSTSATS